MPRKNKKPRTTASSRRPRTRSAAQNEFSDRLFLPSLTILVQNFLGARDLGNLERNCRDASALRTGSRCAVWCDDDAWKAACCRIWPHLVGGDRPDPRGGYRQFFRNVYNDKSQSQSMEAPYPGAWLDAEVAKVRSLPKWSEEIHYDVECGRCGCNCRDGLCPGIPIASEFRYERIHQSDYPHDIKFVPAGEGYQMSGGGMIVTTRFCEPCFERLVEQDILESDQYKKVSAGTLFDAVTEEILNWTGWSLTYNMRQTFFDTTESESWHRLKGVEADDLAVVLSHALAQPGCKYRHLDLAAIHFNDKGFGERGYKAITYALALNTFLKAIEFANHEGWDYYEYEAGGYADLSKGLFRKALEHNKNSSLETLVVCHSVFGYHTTVALQKKKPDLRFRQASRAWG